MLDFKRWISDAEKFVRRFETSWPGASTSIQVAEPAVPPTVSKLDKKLRIKCPEAIRRFLTEGSADLSLRYYWDSAEDPNRQKALRQLFHTRSLCGGPTLCGLKKLSQWQEWCFEGAEQTWIVDEPELAAIWKRAFPFAFVECGDFLAIDCGADGKGAGVVYLDHESTAKPLAADFESFLESWAELGYVGPEHWMLEPFLNAKTQSLKTNSANAKKFQAFLKNAPNKKRSDKK